eukprot:533093_1
MFIHNVISILTLFIWSCASLPIQAASKCAVDDESCNQNAHNQFIQQEFARQSESFYNASKAYKKFNLSPLIEAADIQSSDIILDLACGPGMITTECALKRPHKVYGMDITKEMLDIAKEHAVEHGVDDIIEFIEGNVERLPFNDNTFDIVITRWTFHHFDQLDRVIKEIHRVLKSETGKLVFLEFCAPNGTEKSDVFNAMHTIRDPSHVWAYNETGWMQQVHDGGFAMHNIEIVQRISKEMNWLQFIDWTNPSEADRRARQSVHAIAQFVSKCDCDVGMGFYRDDQDELMFVSNYVIITAIKG